MHFPKFSSKRLGIDLGTSNSLVWSSGEGVVLSEPSVVAVDSVTGKVVAVGTNAYEMLGRTNTDLVAQRPLREGVVADYMVCEAMLANFLNRVTAGNRFMRPEVMVCVPFGITQVERRAVLEATLAAGAKSAYLIDQPVAAAIGAKLPIDTASGSMIVDIGGGQVGAAVVSLGGIVAAGTVKVGGDKLDEAISQYVRRFNNLIIGERMAEEIKIKIGSATNVSSSKTMEVRGRDAISGMPKTIVCDTNQAVEAMAGPLAAIVACIKGVLEQTPPELASDIIDRGIVLTGGISQLKNIEKLISSQTGVTVHVAEDPMQCVVYGTAMALENIESWRRLVTSR